MPMLNAKASNIDSHDVKLQLGVTWSLYRSSMWDDQLAGVQRQFPAPGYSLESFEVPVAMKLTGNTSEYAGEMSVQTVAPEL